MEICARLHFLRPLPAGSRIWLFPPPTFSMAGPEAAKYELDIDDRAPLLPEQGDKTHPSPPLAEGKATRAASIFNLAHTVLGAGILGLPKTLNEAGLALGLVLICLGAAGAVFGLQLLSLCCLRFHEYASYYSLARHAYPPSTCFIDIAVALKCFGVACSYMLVIGRLFPDAFSFFDLGVDAFVDRHFWQSVLMVLVVPLCLLKELRTLRFISLFALLAIFFLIFFVMAYFFAEVLNGSSNDGSRAGLDRDELVYASFTTRTFIVLPTIVFSFTCHQNMPTIVSEMRERTQRATSFVIYVSIALCWFGLVLTATLGYLTFPSSVSSNIIDNYPVNNAAANSVRVAVGLSCLFCIPFQIHPARTCVLNLLFARRPDITTQPRKMLYARIGVGLVLCGAMYLVAFFLTDLGLMFAVVGATGSTAICYLLPGFFYLRITHLAGERRWTAMRVGAAVLVVVGVFMTVCGLYSVIER